MKKFNIDDVIIMQNSTKYIVTYSDEQIYQALELTSSYHYKFSVSYNSAFDNNIRAVYKVSKLLSLVLKGKLW